MRQIEILELLRRRRPDPVTFDEISSSCGLYATNVVRALLDRQLIARVGLGHYETRPDVPSLLRTILERAP